MRLTVGSHCGFWSASGLPMPGSFFASAAPAPGVPTAPSTATARATTATATVPRTRTALEPNMIPPAAIEFPTSVRHSDVRALAFQRGQESDPVGGPELGPVGD